MSGTDTHSLVAFLNEAASYFERRDTGGEDSAFWANVANAENCRKAAARLAQVDALDQQCQGFANLNAKLKADNKELGHSFDMRWGASRRATERWQAANPGNDLTWPDHADLVAWCLDQVSAIREAAKALTDPDCHYDGSTIVIRCESHGDAMKRMRELRDAIEGGAK